MCLLNNIKALEYDYHFINKAILQKNDTKWLPNRNTLHKVTWLFHWSQFTLEVTLIESSTEIPKIISKNYHKLNQKLVNFNWKKSEILILKSTSYAFQLSTFNFFLCFYILFTSCLFLNCAFYALAKKTEKPKSKPIPISCQKQIPAAALLPAIGRGPSAIPTSVAPPIRASCIIAWTPSSITTTGPSRAGVPSAWTSPCGPAMPGPVTPTCTWAPVRRRTTRRPSTSSHPRCTLGRRPVERFPYPVVPAVVPSTTRIPTRNSITTPSQG